ncbi:hexose transporter-like protein [Apiospora marii]|uniref:Hexose transporter-like protein n=1 Tax=Apiospora marii TaxID=335849 RepID=A0ABR1RVA8_9PEZI
MFVVARVVVGFGSAISNASAPVLLAELLPARTRRRILGLLLFCFYVDSLISALINSYYLTRILYQAGVTDTNTQLQINVGLNCWCFLVAVVGSFMLDVIGRRQQALISMAGMVAFWSLSDNTAGIYSTIAVNFPFQGFSSFAIAPMTSLYPPDISQYKLRAAGIAVFRLFDSGFGLLCSFAMSYAMEDLGWGTKGLQLEEVSRLFEGP